MPASIDLREGLGEAFDTLRDEFLPTETVLLLTQSATEDEFDTELELTEKFFFEFSKDRNDLFLDIADDTEELSTAIKAATHIQVDDYYYTIIDGDTTEPQSVNQTWHLHGQLFEKRGHYTEL